MVGNRRCNKKGRFVRPEDEEEADTEVVEEEEAGEEKKDKEETAVDTNVETIGKSGKENEVNNLEFLQRQTLPETDDGTEAGKKAPLAVISVLASSEGRSVVSSINTEDREQFRNCIKRVVFQKVKIIVGPEQLRYDGNIAQLVFQELGLGDTSEEYKQGWWDEDKKRMVRNCLGSKRNNVSGMIKHRFWGTSKMLSYWCEFVGLLTRWL